MRRRGFSLVEVLAALLILAIVITTTIAMFGERQKRLRQANETILAYQALANEAEYWRRIKFSQLDTTDPTFKSDLSLLAPMQPVAASVKIDTPRQDVKNVTLSLTWNNGQGRASLALVRTNTGTDDNLW
jgi:prepilin-type N-terminal cleavage/methylation domain-containing protein